MVGFLTEDIVFYNNLLTSKFAMSGTLDDPKY